MGQSPDLTQAMITLASNVGELTGTIKGMQTDLKANAEETKANTAALQEGKETFAELKGKISTIEEKARCLKGETCVASGEEAIAGHLALKALAWLRKHWMAATGITGISSATTWLLSHLH